VLVCTLSACGGGGDSSPTTAPQTSGQVSQGGGASFPTVAAVSGSLAQGIWKTKSLTAEYILIEPDGSLWDISRLDFGFFSSEITNWQKASIAVSDNGTLSGNFNDIYFGACKSVFRCAVSGLLSGDKLTINTTRTLPGATISAPDWNVEATRTPLFDQPVTFSQVAGTWAFNAFVTGNVSASGSLVISSTGTVSAQNIGGCGFAGQLIQTGKGYFNISMASTSGNCAAIASAVKGIADMATQLGSSEKVLSMYWHSSNQSAYFWGVADK
jgi:hypothetical protein